VGFAQSTHRHRNGKTAMQTATPCAPQAAHSPAFSGAALPLQRVTVSWADLSAQRSYLVAYARRKLMDPALAEDLVHDVFEAVASGRAVFGGRAALRSWLVAILKHKIVDLVRQRSGHDSLEAMGENDDGDTQDSGALACPRPGPEDLAEQRQRLAQTMARIQALPRTLRDAVQLRLLRDDSSADVCRTLAISEQNLFVRLHRARRVLAS
jgi:RNA polymerase sigma-70 factor (ECF subfamily)